MRNPISLLLFCALLSALTASAHAGLIINEIHADPDTTFGDANGDGIRSSSQDEFIELVNVSSVPLDVGGWTLSDATAVRHRFASALRLQPWQAIVVFGGGAPTGDFGGALVATASTGSLSLNNTGDTVRLHDALGTLIDEEAYGREGGRNSSLTRAPDLYGALTLHTNVTGSRFSPGTLAGGGTFTSVPAPNGLGTTLIGLAALYALRHSGRGMRELMHRRPRAGLAP